jgi:hypothetical protein
MDLKKKLNSIMNALLYAYFYKLYVCIIFSQNSNTFR